MKYFIYFFILLSVLTACDDGKVDVASFDFNGSTIKSCNEGIANNFFLYTIKDNRSIIIKIPELNFENQLVSVIAPITIGTDKIVTYREYASSVTDNNICGFPTIVNIPLIKEWSGIGGTIEIETRIVKSPENPITLATSYDSYNHQIRLVNPSFASTDGTQQRADFIVLGTYNKPNLNRLFDFLPNQNLKKCTPSGAFFKISNNQTLALEVDNTIFGLANLGVPKTRQINGTNNKFNFRVHNATQNDAGFCGSLSLANNPSVVENWTARNGGIIEVISATDPLNQGQFKHTIRLINVVLENGLLNFSLGNDYKLGSFNN